MFGIERGCDDRPGLHQADGLDEILILIHQRADQAQFPVLDKTHIHPGMLTIDADDNDGPAFLDGGDGLGESRLDTGAVEGDGKALSAESPLGGLGQGFFFRVGNRFQPAAGRYFQPVFADVRDQDLSALGAGHLANEIADRTRA